MCILFTPAEPTDTLLVLAPLEADGGVQRWQLTYVNSVGSPEVLMVVPVPNRHGMREADFTLFPVLPPDAKRMRSAAEEAFKPYKPEGPAFGARNATFGSAPRSKGMLAVQQVGAYQISMAADFHDLSTRAPWGRFKSAAGRVDAVLAGMQAGYAHGYGFVIAQSTRPVADTGFAVVFRSVCPYVPTAHEAPAMRSDGLVQMDATVLAFNSVLLPASVGTPAHLAAPTEYTLGDHPTYCVDDSFCRTLPGRWHGAAALLRALPVRGAGAIHGGTLVRHARPLTLCRWRLDGLYRNENVAGRPALPADAAAISDVLEQLDSFATLRAELTESTLAATRPGESVAVPEPTEQTAGLHYDANKERVLGRHGPACDFVLVLVGRQLAMPGVPDRQSDAPPAAGAPVGLPQGESFLNMDAAARMGMGNAIDLDPAAFFERRDAPELASLADGASLAGTVYVRVAGTPAPPQLMPTHMRTVTPVPGAAASHGRGFPHAIAS